MPKISTVVTYSHDEIRESLIAGARNKTGIKTGTAQVEFLHDKEKDRPEAARVTLTDTAHADK